MYVSKDPALDPAVWIYDKGFWSNLKEILLPLSTFPLRALEREKGLKGVDGKKRDKRGDGVKVKDDDGEEGESVSEGRGAREAGEPRKRKGDKKKGR